MKTIKIDEDITLKEISSSSPGRIFNAIDRNREYLRKWLPFVDSTQSMKDSEDYVLSVINSDCPKKDMVFEIWFEDDFCGLVGLKEIDHYNRKTELGYWLIESLQGKGIMLRSCRGLIQYAFDALKMNRIQIKCAIGNERSMQIPLRLKFEFEGVEKSGEFVHGKYLDLKTYAILKRDWKQKQNT